MKRIILSLAVFLFAAAAWGQVGIPPGVIFGNPTPGGACSAGAGQIVSSTGTIYTCVSSVWTSTGTASFTGCTSDGSNGFQCTGAVVGGTDGVWQRAVSPVLVGSGLCQFAAQEPSAWVESTPLILTSFSKVVAMVATCGFLNEWPIYGESADGIHFTWFNNFANILGGTNRYAHGAVTISGGNYYYVGANEVAANGIATSADIWQRTGGAGTWTKVVSNVVTTTGGAWKAHNIGNLKIIPLNGGFTLMYDGQTVGGVWSIGLATASTITGTYTDYGSNPVIAAFTDARDYQHIGNADYIWPQNSALPTVPYRWKSTDGSLQTWVQDTVASVLPQTTNDEGINNTQGQLADTDTIVFNGMTFRYFAGYYNQSPDVNHPATLKVAITPLSFAQIIRTQEGNGALLGDSAVNNTQVTSVSTSTKTTPTSGTLQDFTANSHTDQMLLGGNFYWNGSANARQNTSMSGCRNYISSADANQFTGAGITCFTTGGVDTGMIGFGMDSSGNPQLTAMAPRAAIPVTFAAATGAADAGISRTGAAAMCAGNATQANCSATWTAASLVGSTNVQTPAFNSTAVQTTVGCSTSGNAIFSQPKQGTSDKMVLIHLAACLGTASYTYPTAYTNTPSCYASSLVACSVAGTISTTAVTVTGTTSTGSLVLEDY